MQLTFSVPEVTDRFYQRKIIRFFSCIYNKKTYTISLEALFPEVNRFVVSYSITKKVWGFRRVLNQNIHTSDITHSMFNINANSKNNLEMEGIKYLSPDLTYDDLNKIYEHYLRKITQETEQENIFEHSKLASQQDGNVHINGNGHSQKVTV